QVNDTVLAKRWYSSAGLGVQSNKPIAGRHVKHSLLIAVGPVSQATSRQLPRRVHRALTFELSVHPRKLTRVGPKRHDRPSRPGCGVDHTVNHQRRAFELVFGARAEVVGLKAPGDLELVEIIRVDLIERGISGSVDIATIRRPLPVFGRMRRRAVSL